MTAPTRLSTDEEKRIRDAIEKYQITADLNVRFIGEIDYLREQLLNARLKIQELEGKA